MICLFLEIFRYFDIFAKQEKYIEQLKKLLSYESGY